ncbi:MAG: hypothetical protein IJO40_07110 [Thermoguttaceae bacterium]|nr:hypothetical protein [Thermoguttaceae bacterium]
MSDVTQETVERCVFATPTEHGWCNCNRICKIVVCANAERNANLASRSDGAAFHSFPADGYNELFRRDKEPIEAPDGAAFVRSRFCCRRHCIDFETRGAN